MSKIFAVFLGLTVLLAAQPSSAADPKPHILSDAEFGKMTKLTEPGETLSMLGALKGEWDYTFTYWTTPDTAPQVSTGVATNDLILGGRYFSTSLAGPMNINGNVIPYEAKGMIGYDAIKKSYTSVWVDTLSTGMATGSGAYDEKTRVLKDGGHFVPPLTDKDRAYHAEIQLPGGDTYKRVIYTTDAAGKEFKTIEINFSRKHLQ